MRSEPLAFLALACTLALSGCDPALTLEAQAGCGEATQAEERHGPEMLPGRECISCHRGFTAAGTVFESLMDACNTGVADATVEIIDEAGNTTVRMTTNAVGNFYTKAQLPARFRARITAPDGLSQEMLSFGNDGNCSRCHRVQPVEKAKGRLALNPAGPDAGVAESGSAD